jgi:hypothetical protein
VVKQLTEDAVEMSVDLIEGFYVLLFFLELKVFNNLGDFVFLGKYVVMPLHQI